MTSMSNVGNVLSASQSAHRKPVAVTTLGAYWSDLHAADELRIRGHGDPVNGDCVSIWSTVFAETRWYQNGKWLTIEDFVDPASELCASCGGTGIRHVQFVIGPISCPDCGGSGKGCVPKKEVTRPGLGDEIKPELMKKKLRNWT